MSIKQAPYYWLECDGLNDDGTVCGIKSTEGSEHSAWIDEATAEEQAKYDAWIIADTGRRDDKHYCPEHSEND